MPTTGYSAASIIGKVLSCKVPIPIFSNLPERGGKQIGVVAAGNTVGEVYSYVEAKDKTVWWQFRTGYPGSYKWFYAKHSPTAYDIEALRDQGVISVKEQTELDKKKEEDANTPWWEKLFNGAGLNLTSGLVPKLLIGGAAVYLLGKMISGRNNNSQ